MGLRHGGSTESGDADLTDAQIRALSGHRTSAMTALYTKRTMQQRRAMHPWSRPRLVRRHRGQVPGGHAYTCTIHTDVNGRAILEQW
jgi:hypothetical protein